MNNSYALAMRRPDAVERGITTISDLAAQVHKGERVVFATNPEFYERADGLRPLEQTYGFQFGGSDRVVRLDTDRVYQVLRDVRFIDVGLVFATDGRIPAYDRFVLKDDKEFFPNYAMAPVVRQQTLERRPELTMHLGRLCAILNDEVMAELNRRVDVDNVRIPQVASEFLRSHSRI